MKHRFLFPVQRTGVVLRAITAAILCGCLFSCTDTGPVPHETAPVQTAAQTTTAEASKTTTESEPEENTALMELYEQYDVCVPKAEHQARTLYLIDNPADFSERVVLASLQGLAANLSDEQILIKTASLDNYRDILTDKYGVRVSGKLDGRTPTVSGLLSYYAKLLSGYILCDSSPDAESICAAVTLSGQLGAVVIPQDLETLAKSAGLDCVLDVRGWTDTKLRESTYWEHVNPDIAFEQPTDMAPKLMDLAVMSHSYFSFYHGTDAAEHKKKYGYLNSGAVVYGYNNTLGEYDTVRSFSELNISLIPSDHASNLSTLSGFVKEEITQKREWEPAADGTNVHTVCLILSDGDNLQWITNDFQYADKWFASDRRGDFPMGWGLPATTIDTIAPMMDYFYEEERTGDEFLLELSGVGYTFPSRWSEDARRKTAETVASYMKRSDFRYLEVLDDNGFDPAVLSAFTSQDAVSGIFYIDYSNYAGKRGKVLWSDGKPMVSARYRLWADLSDGAIAKIADKVNKASTDTASEDAYSFIIVHAWSGLDDSGNLVPGGNTMDAIAALIDAFGEQVEVVTPDVFMERIKNNVSHP